MIHEVPTDPGIAFTRCPVVSTATTHKASTTPSSAYSSATNEPSERWTSGTRNTRPYAMKAMASPSTALKTVGGTSRYLMCTPMNTSVSSARIDAAATVRMVSHRNTAGTTKPITHTSSMTPRVFQTSRGEVPKEGTSSASALLRPADQDRDAHATSSLSSFGSINDELGDTEITRAAPLAKWAEKRSCFVFGPRQTGKSSLLRAAFGEPAHSYDLLDSREYARLLASPRRLDEEIPAGTKLVIIDEVRACRTC